MSLALTLLVGTAVGWTDGAVFPLFGPPLVWFAVALARLPFARHPLGGARDFGDAIGWVLAPPLILALAVAVFWSGRSSAPGIHEDAAIGFVLAATALVVWGIAAALLWTFFRTRQG